MNKKVATESSPHSTPVHSKDEKVNEKDRDANY